MVLKRSLGEFSGSGHLSTFWMFYKMSIMTSCVTWKLPLPWLPMASCSDLSRVDSFSELFPKKLQINPRILMKIFPGSQARNLSEILSVNQAMKCIYIDSMSHC